MAGSNTQFLQVPKALPHRRARSRSKSRSRSPTPAGDSTQHHQHHPVSPPASPKSRPQTPPVPRAAHSPWKPALASSPAATTKTKLHRPIPAVRAPSPPTGDAPLCVMDVDMTDDAGSAGDQTNGTNYDDLNGDLYTLDQCATPPPEIPLRQRLIGAWKLESYIAYPTATSTVQRPTYPMTKNVTGMILYTPDGYMSAQMLIPGQQSFKRGEGAEPQWAEAAKRSFTYCGPYYITDEGPGREEILRHTFQACNLPGWIGDIQVRTCRFEEDGQVLVLGSEEPTEIKGDKRIPVLKWRRARDNVTGEPPPPIPQIKISGPSEE